MIRDLRSLAALEHDVLVVGGGIQGLAIAREIAERGLGVALVEKDDFGAATSSNSQRVIHGGVRYLQSLDFARMRRSVLDRRAWMREFPHLVRPRPILLPTFRGSGKPRAMIRAAMTLYEWLNPDLSRGLPSTHRVPRHESLSRARTLGLAPRLAGLPLDGAILFHDAAIEDSERLTIAIARKAWRAGARLANHARAAEWIRDGARVRGARVVDELDGADHAVRARLVIHAGGPWAARAGAPLVPLVRAMALLVRPIEERFAVAVPSAREKRLLFFVPWRGHTLAGVHEKTFDGDPDELSVAPSEIESFLDEIEESLPGAGIRREDVRRVFAGLLPASDDRSGSPASEDRVLTGDDGLVRVLGVKFTTAPSLARRVADFVESRLDRPHRDASGEHAGDESTADLEELEHIRETESRARDVLSDEPFVDAAQVIRAVRREMACTLADVALRRTPLAMLGLPCEPALRRCADIVGDLLGWDAARREREMADVRVKAVGPVAETEESVAASRRSFA